MTRTRWEIEDGRYPCPHRAEGCEVEPFASLYHLKKHLTEAHGGFTTGDLGDSVKESREDAGDREPAGKREAPPRRSSRHNRELNEKANRLLRLGTRSVLTGISAEEWAEFHSLSDEVGAAAMGVEFDFENAHLVRLNGRFGLLLLTIFIALVPHAKSIREIIASARGRKQAVETEPPARDSEEPEETTRDEFALKDGRQL